MSEDKIPTEEELLKFAEIMRQGSPKLDPKPEIEGFTYDLDFPYNSGNDDPETIELHGNIDMAGAKRRYMKKRGWL